MEDYSLEKFISPDGKSERIAINYLFKAQRKMEIKSKLLNELYFRSKDETFCSPLFELLNDAAIDKKETIVLIKAVPDKYNVDDIWCGHEGEVGERSLCNKSSCSFYNSKSGKGKCSDRGIVYRYGEAIEFNISEFIQNGK